MLYDRAHLRDVSAIDDSFRLLLGQIEVEAVLPWLALDRARLDFGEVGEWLIRRFVTGDEHRRAGAMLGRWGVVAIAASRPVPIPAETVAILAGSSPVTWPQLAAAAGSIVPAAAYAWAGAQGIGMQMVVFGGVIVVTALLLLAGRRLAGRETTI